jgi:3-oxoacyl-[acyl-carrier-protein] synthase III
MKAVHVDSLTFAVGETVETLEEAHRQGRLLSPVEALRDAGFVAHHVCRPETTAYDLACRAVKAIGSGLGEVDAIVYSTCLPLNGNLGSPAAFEATRDVKHLMDFPGSHLQAELGLPGAAVIGLNQQACTGMLGSIRLARALITSEPEVRRVLCVTSDRFPQGALYEQAYNLISDGAAGCVVSDAPGAFRLVASHALTNGAFALASDEETVGSYFTWSHRLIGETLRKAGLTLADVTWVVPQNTNVKAARILSRLLGVDHERFYYPTIERLGHMISGDNVANLKALVDDGRVRPGDRVLLFMAGYGLHWQCVILERC